MMASGGMSPYWGDVAKEDFGKGTYLRFKRVPYYNVLIPSLFKDGRSFING